VAAPVATYVGVAQGAVEFDGGLDAVASYASSPGVTRGFCERCGTALYYASTDYPGELHLFRSNFAHPETFEPTAHVFFDEREADFDVYDDLPRYGAGSSARPQGFGPRPALRILYLCTGNSARSILAEAITNLRAASVGDRRVRAHSAGSSPTGKVAPDALKLLGSDAARLGRLRSKSWDEFTGTGAPAIDLVITLCDAAAAEACPVFPGAAQRRHWGLPDPASGATTFEETRARIEVLVEDLFRELGAA
jgi:arsenate reductase